MEEIAEATDVHKDTVSIIVEICRKKFSSTESDKIAASHAIDFEPRARGGNHLKRAAAGPLSL
jgi:hypothetical protein